MGFMGIPDVSACETAERLMWAKTGKDGKWMCLRRHLCDAGAMAGVAWDHFISPGLLRTLAGMADPSGEIGFDETCQALRSLAVFMASIHDVGKANPVFQHMIASGESGFLCERLTAAGFGSAPEGYRNEELRHEAVSGVSLAVWALNNGFDRRHAMALQAMISGHHGFFTEYAEALKCGVSDDSSSKWRVWLDGARTTDARPWSSVRAHIISGFAAQHARSGALRAWARMSLTVPVQMIIAGIVVAADWMASDENAFPVDTDGVLACDESVRAAKALDVLNLRPAWHPLSESGPHDDRWFRAMFPSLDASATMNPMQRAMTGASSSMESPSLIICESEMGSGKTEAALASARILASRFGCDGLSFALPTMATADAMFARCGGWIGREGPECAVTLSHGNAWLNPALRRRRASGRRSWTDRGRMSVLSTFRVSTIDGLLRAALKGKHVELDMLGAAGKVTIMDEMHSADEYMLAYVERLLEWLSAYHAPVIILSATLPESTRRRLVKAYCGVDDADDDGGGYPLITVASSDGHVRRIHCGSNRSGSHTIKVIPEKRSRLADDIIRETDDGGCAAAIMDTVSSAQALFSRIRSMSPDAEVMLLHSRFCADDRHAHERRLLRMLGPGGARPGRLIVVSTQVIEQSLDLDFDFMHTENAPIDILLQRAGRLHRRGNTMRPSGADDTILRIIGDAHAGSPPVRGVNDLIYGRYHLLASSAQIGDGCEWDIPGSIPHLISGSYDRIPNMPGWGSALETARAELDAELADKRRRARQSLLSSPDRSGSLTGMTSKILDSDQHGVRDGIWSLSAVLLRANDDGTFSPYARPDVRIPADSPPSWSQAPALLGSAVPLPMGLSSPARLDGSMRDIMRATAEGPLQAWGLKGSPVRDDGLLIVDDDGMLPDIGGWSFSYDSVSGLSRIR